jgi:hypothetical protein
MSTSPLQSPAPGPSADEPLSKAQRHTTFAAVTFLVIFVLAGSISLYSAYLLWRGEDAGPVLAALPAGCELVWMVDEPQEAAAALRALGKRSGRADKLELWAATLDKARQLPGLNPDEAWGFCRRGSQWYAAAAVASEDPAAGAQVGQQLWESLRGLGLLGQPAVRWKQDGARWLGSDAGGQVQVAVRSAKGVAQITWQHQGNGASPAQELAQAATAAVAPQSPLDAAATLDALQTELLTKPLQKDEAAREALERVGGGQMRLVARGTALTVPLQAWLDAQGQAAWKDAMPWVLWGGAALRVEGDRIKLHGQLGGGQRWAVWLKERFDTVGEFDAATVIPRDHQWAGVLRVPRFGWAWLAGLDPAVAPLMTLFGEAKAWQPLLSGHVAWFGDGPCLTAVARLRPEAAIPPELPPVGTLPGCPQSLAKRLGDRVLVGSAQGIAAAEKVAADPGLGAQSDDKDRQRLQRDTQGFWVNGARSVAGAAPGLGWPAGPLQAEWIWLDTGLVVAVDLAPAISR